MERNLNSLKIREDDRIDAIVNHVKNQANAVYKQLAKEKYISWFEFKLKFSDHFKTTKKEFILRDQLSKLKQKTTVIEYSDEFCDLKTKLGENIKDNEALYLFINVKLQKHLLKQ